jgi:hypothetical protein
MKYMGDNLRKVSIYEAIGGAFPSPSVMGNPEPIFEPDSQRKLTEYFQILRQRKIQSLYLNQAPKRNLISNTTKMKIRKQ